MVENALPDLFGAENPNAQRANYVHQLNQTIETYDIELQVVLELVQNALDAVARSGSGEVHLDVNLPERTVTVIDSGTGFPPTPELLFLGGTDKVGDSSQKGNIGVGLKVVIFSSESFTLHSVSADALWDLEIHNADQTLAEAKTDSSVKPAGSWTTADPPEGEATGTSITVKFRGRQIHDWIATAYDQVFRVQELVGDAGAADILFAAGKPFASKAEAFLETYFRTSPYTGDVKKLLTGDPATPLKVRLIVGNPVEQFPDDSDISDMFEKAEYEQEIACVYADFSEYLEAVPNSAFRVSILANQDMPPGGQSAAPLPDRIRIFHLTERSQYESLIANRVGSISAGFDAALDAINGIYLILGDPTHLRRFIPGGPKRLISSNGVLTAHPFPTPRGARHELYVPRIHMIVDVDADLNYGKRHLTNRYLVGQLYEYFAECYSRTLFESARVLGKRVRLPRDVNDRSYVDKENLPFGFPIVKKPEVEQDVVALFSALMGAGHISGYELFGLSQVEQYDGRFYADRASGGKKPTFTTDDHLHKLEFKLNLRALCDDFDGDIKQPEDIAVAIVWHNDVSDGKYKVLDLEASTTFGSGSQFPHVNYVLWDTNESHEVQLIILDELVASLAD